MIRHQKIEKNFAHEIYYNLHNIVIFTFFANNHFFDIRNRLTVLSHALKQVEIRHKG